MSQFQGQRVVNACRGTTLNGLKDQLYSLNMRMLLAMRNHDEEAQEEIGRQLAEVQEEIARMSLGGGWSR